MPQPGFLAVTSQPSELLSIEDFHAWYEEEHIPLRLNRLRSFLSGARYRAIDGPEAGPGWLAMYEIDDTRSFDEESYTSLRLMRSEREASVIDRLGVLTRLAGEELVVCGDPEETKSTGLKMENPSPCVITHFLDFTGEKDNTNRLAREWATEVGSKSIPNWVRVRLVKVLEKGKTSMGKATEMPPEEKAPYYVVHEFTGGDFDAMDILLGTLSTGNGKITGYRRWELHKAYPCIAQGNVEPA